MVSLGLLAGGLIKGIGDGMQQDIQYEREMALELLRENRRARERQEDRAFAVEDRDVGFDREDKRYAQQTEQQERRDVLADERQDRRDDRLDARAAARDAALAARSGGGENKPPADVAAAQWYASLDDNDPAQKRQKAAFDRLQAGKGDPERRALDYGKLISEETKNLLEEYDSKTPDGKSWADAGYEARKAEAKRRVDERVQMGREIAGGGKEPPAAAEPRPQPGGGMMRKPEASISDELTNRSMDKAVQGEKPSAGPTRIQSQA
jgi:hypothetical protein